MISQEDSDDGRIKTKVHLMKEVERMEITRVKMEMGSFLYNPESQGSMCRYGFMFTQA